MRQIALLSSALIGAASGIGAAQAARTQTAPPTATSPANQGELLPDEQIQQVLNRLTFGPRPGDAEKVRAMGIDKWIDLQLHPERIPDQPATDLVARYAVFSTPTGDIVRSFEELQRLQRQVKREDANDTTMDRAKARQELLAQNPQLRQVAQRNQQMVGEIQ